jgi:hypothetical protein
MTLRGIEQVQAIDGIRRMEPPAIGDGTIVVGKLGDLILKIAQAPEAAVNEEEEFACTGLGIRKVGAVHRKRAEQRLRTRGGCHGKIFKIRGRKSNRA